MFNGKKGFKINRKPKLYKIGLIVFEENVDEKDAYTTYFGLEGKYARDYQSGDLIDNIDVIVELIYQNNSSPESKKTRINDIKDVYDKSNVVAVIMDSPRDSQDDKSEIINGCIFSHNFKYYNCKYFVNPTTKTKELLVERDPVDYSKSEFNPIKYPDAVDLMDCDTDLPLFINLFIDAYYVENRKDYEDMYRFILSRIYKQFYLKFEKNDIEKLYSYIGDNFDNYDACLSHSIFYKCCYETIIDISNKIFNDKCFSNIFYLKLISYIFEYQNFESEE